MKHSTAIGMRAPLNARQHRAASLGILWNVINIYQHSANLSNRLLGAYDLPLSQYVLLSLFMSAPEEGRTVTSISHALHQNQPTISKIVQKLLQKELVDSKPTFHDARSKILTITEAGKHVHGMASETLETALAPIFNEWTHHDISHLMGQLQVIRSYLETRA
ncbi:MAG: winged helix DNA-binding protein [Okeania sp. SIO3H1]|nr:winged helix DNA-binding protein [Okeania sp. SIO3H1]